MTLLYAIACVVAVGILAFIGYVVWCAATILNKGIDFSESYPCPVRARGAVQHLQATELKYALLEDLEVDDGVLAAAQVEVDAARVECERQIAAAEAISGPETAQSRQEARMAGAGSAGHVPAPVRTVPFAG